MSTFADRVLAFNRSLEFQGTLPPGIRVMNPFRENPEVMPLAEQFYRKYYADNRERCLILGINPGRFGGGVTGIPFTDPKRLRDRCGIEHNLKLVHEPSSVFVYAVVDAYGGPERFYGDFYINSICPLGFTSATAKGKEVNYNYYDNRALQDAVYDFMLDSLQRQLAFGVRRDIGFCLGTGKNYDFISRLNDKEGFFDQLIPLEHPRFVMQYRAKRIEEYVARYLELLGSIEKAG